MSTRVLDSLGEPSADIDPATSDAHVHPVRTAAWALVASLVWAGACNFALELLQDGLDARLLISDGLTARPALFLLGSLVIWLLLLAAIVLTGRLWLPCALLLVTTIAVGLADNVKLQIRNEPLYPSDFAFASSPGFLAKMVSPGSLAGMLALVVLAGGLTLLVGRLVARHFPRLRRTADPRAWLFLLVARLVCLVACLAALTYASHFNSSGNLLRKAYDLGGSEWTPWFQGGNYVRNGFVGGTLYNLRVPAMESPDGYSAATMRELSSRYVALASAHNAGRDARALDDVNIVVVLSESFSDPTRVRGVQAAQDPIPFTRGLMKRTVSGKLLAHQVGGGTANVEFECLTGMSVSQFAPQMTTPYQMLVPNYEEFPSSVRYFGNHGHKTVAIHPFLTQLYRRNEAYPSLGFEEFINQDTLEASDKIERGEFISDASAFQEVEHQIKETSTPLFVNLVTMQNHGPYLDQYDNPIDVRGLSGDAEGQAGDYLRGLRYSDRAMQTFLHQVSASSEKTIVVFYGDHMPGFWPQEVRDRNGDRRMKETPYFIWSNYAAAKRSPSATVSPPYLLPEALDMVDAPLPPYYVLLDRLRSELPGMDLGSYIDADDAVIKPTELSEPARSLLHDFRLVQYDLSVGKKYSLASMFDQHADQ